MGDRLFCMVNCSILFVLNTKKFVFFFLSFGYKKRRESYMIVKISDALK